MRLTFMIDINEALEVDQRLRSQGQRSRSNINVVKFCFAFKSRPESWIRMKPTCRIDINYKLNLTQGRGHKTKGQG